MHNTNTTTPASLSLLVACVVAVTFWSAWNPHDWPTWLLEAAPVLIAVPLLIATRRSFPLTPLVYGLIALHAVILLIGAHYTYAEVPWFNGLRDQYGLARNHYDRIGHFAQGFVPAMIIREILLRRSPLTPGKWLLFITTCIALAISAFYEFIEWWVAIAANDGAVAFLGTQGDPWDTQWDMFLALCGALAAQLLFWSTHDFQLKTLLKSVSTHRTRND